MLYTLRPEGGALAAKYSYANGRGDVVAQANQGGTVTWTASYEAFGTRKLETGTNVDRQRANTKEEDPTGLLNEGFRYRDLETGTWLSRDPAGFVDGPNLYAYVQQNPWTKFDPEGLFWSALVTAGFAAYDTYQYATGQTSGAEYAQAMALNGAALVADIATAGQGGGLAVRAANATVRVAKAVDRASNTYDAAAAVVENGGDLVSAIGDGDGRKALRAAASLAIDAGGGKKAKGDGGFRGGAHRDTQKPIGDKRDSHHMPAKSVSGIDEMDGPAIQMDKVDHEATSSWGRGHEANAYRREIKGMIDGGDMRKAMATEIKDVRRAAQEVSGDQTKYNGAMREMMDYSRSKGYIPKNPQDKIERTK